jgi:hypothetical protein
MSGFHGLTAAGNGHGPPGQAIATIPATMASTHGSIGEVLTDLDMTNNPSSGRTNTTAPEIAVAGQKPMAIGLLVSVLDRRPSRGRQMFRAPGTIPRSEEINARNAIGQPPASRAFPCRRHPAAA